MDIKELNVTTSHQKKHHPWEEARLKVINSLTSSFFHDTTKKNVLDIGCGDVFFINEFCKKHKNLTPYVVDIAFTDEIIENLKKEYQNDKISYYKDVKDVNLVEGKANVIFLLDVIEHIENDIDFLNSLTKLSYVDDNTLFIITVPSFNSLYCNRDKWLGHYRRYSRKMLIERAQQSGLYIANNNSNNSGYFFFLPLFLRLIQKLMDSKSSKQDEKGIGNWNGGKLVTSIYKNLLLCDFYVSRFLFNIGIKLPGLSTYLICRKQKD